jgi:hypothetical protein
MTTKVRGRTPQIVGAILFLIGIVVFPVGSAQRAPIPVYVQTQYFDEFNNGVLNALKARIAATTRYALTENPAATTLLVGINCAEMSSITHLTYPSHNSGVCAWSISYFPANLGLPVALLSPGLATGSASTVGEGMFQEFVRFTDDHALSATDERLQTALKAAAEREKVRP